MSSRPIPSTRPTPSTTAGTSPTSSGRTAVVAVSTRLDAPPDAVWRAVTTPAAFRFVTRGLVSIDGVDDVADWGAGATITGRLRVLGVPFSRHRITVESIDHDARALQSDEAGGPIRSWRHLITVEALPSDPERSLYRDVIEIDAGFLTPAIAAFAHVFYRARQRRWRRLAPVLAAVVDTATDSPAAASSS